MHPEREVVVATGASEYLEERALDEEEERAITEFVSNGCGCRIGNKGLNMVLIGQVMALNSMASRNQVTVFQHHRHRVPENIPVPTWNREEEVRADKSSLR